MHPEAEASVVAATSMLADMDMITTITTAGMAATIGTTTAGVATGMADAAISNRAVGGSGSTAEDGAEDGNSFD